MMNQQFIIKQNIAMLKIHDKLLNYLMLNQKKQQSYLGCKPIRYLELEDICEAERQVKKFKGKKTIYKNVIRNQAAFKMSKQLNIFELVKIANKNQPFVLLEHTSLKDQLFKSSQSQFHKQQLERIPKIKKFKIKTLKNLTQVFPRQKKVDQVAHLFSDQQVQPKSSYSQIFPNFQSTLPYTKFAKRKLSFYRGKQKYQSKNELQVRQLKNIFNWIKKKDVKYSTKLSQLKNSQHLFYRKKKQIDYNSFIIVNKPSKPK